MRLRSAYETLSDETKKAGYDASLSRFLETPEEVGAAIMEAERLGEKRLWEDAVNILKKSVYYKSHEIQFALCRLYLDMEKSGKAVKIIEKLIFEKPDNADYLRLAVKVYMERGYTNKAIDVRRKLDQLKLGNEADTAELMLDDNYDPYLIGQAVERIENQGKRAPLLCARILDICLYHDSNDNSSNRQISFNFTDNEIGISQWDDPLFAAKKLEEHSIDIPKDKKEEIHSIILNGILFGMYHNDCYSILPHIEKVIINAEAEEILKSHQYKITLAGYLALKAVNAGYPKKMAVLKLMYEWSQIDILGEESNSDFKNEIICLETDILMNFRRYTPHIVRFNNDFPIGNKKLSDFFSMVLRSTEHKIHNEVCRRYPQVMMIDKRIILDWLGEDDDSDNYNFRKEPREPVRVTKIGRNEPCPCGSKKKYKKCCGG